MPREESPSGPREFIAPRYWPIWTLVGAMWCLAKLPYRVQLPMGRLLGELLFLIARRRRRIARINLSLCFPALSGQEQHRLLKRHFHCLGMAIIELGLTYWGGRPEPAKVG